MRIGTGRLAFLMAGLLATGLSSQSCGGRENTSPGVRLKQTSLKLPSARAFAAMARGAEGIYLFGGVGKDGLLGDFWVLKNGSGEWQKLENGPSPRAGATLVWSEQQKKLILFGGWNYDAFGQNHFLRELWTYSSEDGWQRIYFSEGPAGRAFHAAWWMNERMYLFGGWGGRPAVQLKDIWAYDPKEEHFERVATDAPFVALKKPCVWCRHDGLSCIFLIENNVLELYNLDFEADRWERLKAFDPGRVEFAATLPDGRFLAFLGPDRTKSGTEATGARRTVVVIDGAGHEPTRSYEKLENILFGATCLHSNRNLVVCAGGVAGKNFSSSVWEAEVGQKR